ncbi:hypothetical protein Tco_1224687 [Tanacetum coccineum]
MGTCAPYLRRETFTPLTKTPKEILAMERTEGTTRTIVHLKKQIEDVVASGKLAHLVKDINKDNQRNRGQGRGNIKVITWYDQRLSSLKDLCRRGSSSEIMYEHCFKSFSANTKSRLRKSSAPLVGFSGEIYHPLGLIDL